MRDYIKSSAVLVILLIGMVIGMGASINLAAPNQSFQLEVVATNTSDSNDAVDVANVTNHYFAYGKSISRTDLKLEYELAAVEVIGTRGDPSSVSRLKIPNNNDDAAVTCVAQNTLDLGNNISYESKITSNGTRIISMIDPTIVKELRERKLLSLK